MTHYSMMALVYTQGSGMRKECSSSHTCTANPTRAACILAAIVTGDHVDAEVQHSSTADLASAGVLGNKVLPTWLITILLLLLLVWLTEKMFVKAFKVHASEKERAEHERAQADQDGHDCEHDEGA